MLYEGRALPHFNEVDECSGFDALVTNRIWTSLGFDPETTLASISAAGEDYVEALVRLLGFSKSPAPFRSQHFIGGYSGTVSERQPPMYFRLGGGTLKGISKPGDVVWSRVYVDDGALKADLGIARSIELPRDETERRWRITTPQWPMMHAVLPGLTRDQMKERHKANHIQVAYAPDAESAKLALAAKAAAFRDMGLDVYICGSAA